MARTYRWWPRLKEILLILCRFYKDNKGKLPNDLPPNVVALLLLVEIACDELEEYDKTHVGGGPK